MHGYLRVDIREASFFKGVKVKLAVKIKNFGRTPASDINLSGFYVIKIADALRSSDTMTSSVTDKTHLVKVYPGDPEVTILTSATGFTRDECLLVETGVATLYVGLKAKYTDVFSEAHIEQKYRGTFRKLINGHPSHLLEPDLEAEEWEVFH